MSDVYIKPQYLLKNHKNINLFICSRATSFKSKRVKAIHQTISSDNPYVELKYSEYIL